MGTNYYGRPLPTPEQEEAFVKLANERKWYELRRELDELDDVHIGKSSVGWKFTFDHNDWRYFGKDKAQVVAFINSLELWDEYGDEITHDDFWAMVEAKKGGLDTTDYYAKYPGHRNPIIDMMYENEPDQYYVGDLYFSTHTNFS